MNSPDLIRLETYWRLASWDDFTHIDNDGVERINYLQPYFYRMDDGCHHQIARLQKATNLEKLKEMILDERIYVLSKASTDEFKPIPYYERKEDLR